MINSDLQISPPSTFSSIFLIIFHTIGRKIRTKTSLLPESPRNLSIRLTDFGGSSIHMGCISSKNDDSLSSISSSDSLKLRRLKSRREHSFEPLERIKEEREDENTGDCIRKIVVEVSNTDSDNKSLKQFGISARFRRSSEGELVAAGWPAWLSAAAGEAIDG
ncbi:hypothetical protein L1987_05526 [Smallanthus sonchifolius]|uniref:Uncharacterized protein n=1 Tax=Smallanthus sonchifolius TaxID=185202 RepID=A0ACB9JVR3_9ASTR|nr:hypothetical protein L1987_05526 [Smallanthus sonchifolius]